MQASVDQLTVASAAVLIFLVMDPFGNIPFFISALQPVKPERRRRVVARELTFALAALVLFLLLGRQVLGLLHVSQAALSVAGGIVLFLIAIKMIFPTQSGGSGAEELDGEPFLVPLAIPYVAGPSALATVLLIMNREPARWPEWLAAVGLAWFASAVVISLSSPLARVLGKRGLIALERLMGMLLVVIAIQMAMNGTEVFVASLRAGG